MHHKESAALGKIREDLIVTKANKLVEASYRLNVSEQRVMALLVTQIHPDDEDFKPYRFKVNDLEGLVADGDRKQQGLYSRVKALTRGLQEKVLQIQEPSGLLQVSWLSAAQYFEGRGEVELEFSPRLKPYLLQLKERFTSYKLASIIKLRSRYSVRLYELLKQYEALGERSFELAELRKILGLNKQEYSAWKDFRVRVVDLAQRELPKRTDLAFSYTPRKKGRAVHWIDFKIWSTRTQDTPKAKTKNLAKEARACWDGPGGHGNCGATWAAKKDNPADVCHWCQKFEHLRKLKILEERGQQRIPGFDPSKTIEQPADDAA